MISIERKLLASSAVMAFFVVGIASARAQFSPPTCTPPNCSPAVIQNIPLAGVAQTAGINITGDAKIGATFQAGANAPVLSAAAQNLYFGNVGNASSAGSLLLLQKGGVDRFRVDLAGNMTIAGTITAPGGVGGDGSSITNINATNITSGTLSAARLPANVAYTDASQNFTGNNAFSGMSTYGSAGLGLSGAQNLIYGNIDTASTGSLLLLQKESVDQFRVDNAGNLTVAGNVTAAGNITAAGQSLCRADGTNCPPTLNGSGTLNTIVKFTPSGSAVGNSQITDDGTTVTVADRLAVNGNATLGDAAGDVLTSNFGTWTMNNDVTVNEGTKHFAFLSNNVDVGAAFTIQADSLTTGTGARIRSSGGRNGASALLQLSDTGASSAASLSIVSTNPAALSPAINIDLDNGNTNNAALQIVSDETAISGTAADTEKFHVNSSGSIQTDGALQVDGSTTLGDAAGDTLHSNFGTWVMVNDMMISSSTSHLGFSYGQGDGVGFSVIADALTVGTGMRIKSAAPRSGPSSLLQLSDVGSSTAASILNITSANSNATSPAIIIDLDNGIANNNVITVTTDETTVSGTAADTEKFHVTASGNIQTDGALQVDGNTTLGNNYTDRTSVNGELVLGSQAGNPVGVNGMMFYNSLNNKFRCFENGAWIDCGAGSDTLDDVAARDPIARRNIAIDNDGGGTFMGGAALTIESTGTGLYSEGNSYGVQGTSASIGVWGSGGTYGGYFGTTTAAGYGVYAQAFDANHTAIYGNGNMQVSGEAGFGGLAPNAVYGVLAQGSSAGGRFVDNAGTSQAVVGYGAYGVYANGSSAGVYGYDTNSSLVRGALGNGNYGVYGANTAASGTTNYGGYFYASNGLTNYGLYVGAGTMRTACATADVETDNIVCEDIAEVYQTGEKLEPGDVVVWRPDTEHKLFKSRRPYDDAIAGIYSTSPGVLMGNEDVNGKVGVDIGNANTAATIKRMGDTQAPVALAGRVPVKVTNEGGAIKPGDLLTSSSKAGYAMKADGTGRVIGIAMESFNGKSGKILCYVNLHYWVNPKDYRDLKAEVDTLKIDIEDLKKR